MRKLTPLEKQKKEIEKIVIKLKKLENRHNKKHFRLACSRYVTRTNEEIRLKHKINSAKEDLKELERERKK